MKDVLPDNLVPGVQYRIHRNSDQDYTRDTLGTFINHTRYGPRFSDLVLYNREGHAHLTERHRNPGPRPYSRINHTFFESGETIERMQNEKQLKRAIEMVLNGEVGPNGEDPDRKRLGLPGLGTAYVGRGRRRTRRRARSYRK